MACITHQASRAGLHALTATRTDRFNHSGMFTALLLASILVVLARPVQAQDLAALPDDLTGLSLESLMNIQVTSVSKHAENLNQAAAAVYVLSREDIRRSGVRTLPDALRLVPGLTVAQVDAHSWVVTARGFSSTLADKLEVLMDGRSLYTPLFSGVFWEAQETLLEDIDRIEVIRGPGATLWGANAVNGVINIVTRNSSESHGTYATAGGGGHSDGFASGRHGGSLGEDGHYRVYAKTSNYADNQRSSGADANDGWDLSQAGFRTDWRGGPNDNFTFQGDLYEGSIDGLADDETFSGHNLIGRWIRDLGNDSDLSLQLYYDHTDREIPGLFSEDRDTYDVNLQHRFQWMPRHEVVWGLGYRTSSDSIDSPSPAITFTPDSRTVNTKSLFVQDKISVIPDRLKVTVGSKFEDNDFTGLEVQPSLRFAYTPDPQHTIWGAVSRAVRIPNRLDDDIRLFAGTPPTGFISGSRNFESETLIAFELGYRVQPRSNLSLDFALYYNDYDELRGVDNSALPEPVISNEGEGSGHGLEVSALWQVDPKWRLRAAYNYQRLDIRAKSGSSDTSIENSDRNDPHHQFLLNSAFDLRDNWTLDGTLRFVGGLPDQNVDAYTDLDLRLAWQYSPTTEFALVGRNLLHSSHVEFGTPDPVEVERSLMGTVTWRFE